METYANVLLYAVPFFFVLILIEFLYGWWKGHQTLRTMDTISSLSSGMTNTLVNLLGLLIVVLSYEFLVDRIAFMQMESEIWMYLVGFVAIDFASYCSHRLSHYMNIFWNRHMIHHSSEEFNLPCALRQEISETIGFSAIFLIPAAIVGVPAKVIAVIAPLHLFMQFWYHTRHIPKLGFLEYIIVTPSQHRVHHAINAEYIDKNLSAVFCIWDRMFGTFQEELDDVPCVYGVLKAPETWNPIRINYQHVWGLIKDAWRAESWWDKARIWFMPTGWRPEDVKEKYPVQGIDDPYTHVKYDNNPSSYLTAWTWIQFILTNLFLAHVLYNFSAIGFPSLFVYGAFIFSLIYAYCSLMDNERVALFFEVFKSVFGIGILYVYGNWFGINTGLYENYILAIYFILSIAVVAAFTMGVIPMKNESTASLYGGLEARA